MIGVILDIDDTLVNTKPRTKKIMESILKRNITLDDIQNLTLEKVFFKYASEEQKAKVNELKNLFMNLLLCRNEEGINSLKYNKPIPFAANALENWTDICKIVYLTGRLRNIRDQTLDELKRFGFPIENTELIMFNPEDWGPGISLLEARKRLLSSIIERLNVVRVVDDFPGYFQAYKHFSIPDRIGFNRFKLHTQNDYISQGATRVINSWEKLSDDPPKKG